MLPQKVTNETKTLPLSRFKLVSHPVNRLDKVGLGVDCGDLPSQLLDVAVDGSVAHDALVGVDPLHELAARIEPSRAGGEKIEKSELDGGQLEIASVKGGPVAGLVEGKAAFRNSGAANRAAS